MKDIKPKKKSATKKSAKKASPKKPKKLTQAKVGRPTDYKPEYCDQAYKLCLLGFTDEQLSTFFEVAESTINKWKLDYPEFSESVRRGKDSADGDAAHGMFKRAVGCTVKEVTYERIDSKETLELSSDGEMIRDAYKKKIVIKELPPETGASLNWLKNRQPAKWRDKQDINLTGSLHTLSDDELNNQLNEKLKILSTSIKDAK